MQRFKSIFRHSVAATAVAGLLAGSALLAPAAKAADTVRVALGDVVSVETLAFLVAIERAKDRGVEYEMTSFSKEELAIQSIVNGQADLGVGTYIDGVYISRPAQGLTDLQDLEIGRAHV